MGDCLKKVKPGDPLAIPAATFNTFVDAAQDFLRRQRDVGRTPVADRPPFETVLLKNASGADRGRFDVLGIDAPVFTPTDSLETFTNGIALAGVTPTDSHAGNFAVLVEPIQAGQIGRACILGACPVKVNIVSTSDAFADVEAGVTDRLKSGSSGAARILWKESGTGEKWAVVRLGNPAGGASAIPVKLTASLGGGSYTGKEQVWTGSAWSDKPGATDITCVNLSETCRGVLAGFDAFRPKPRPSSTLAISSGPRATLTTRRLRGWLRWPRRC
jgi:hypothetical protein